jgi:hypothetical protein
MRKFRLIGVALVFVGGCSNGPAAIRPPKVNASSAASAAIEQFDHNGDGQLSKEEWSTSPALAAVASGYDKNADGVLTADEIKAGVAAWQQSGVGARAVSFVVTLDGHALAGATVRLVPAPFLGDVIKEASAGTNAGGAGQLSVKPEDRPKNAPNIALMQPGLYSVVITHPSVKIPPKYNTETTLGIEITSSNPGPEGVKWSLSSK